MNLIRQGHKMYQVNSRGDVTHTARIMSDMRTETYEPEYDPFDDEWYEPDPPWDYYYVEFQGMGAHDWNHGRPYRQSIEADDIKYYPPRGEPM